MAKRRPRSRRDYVLSHSPNPRVRFLHRIERYVGAACIVSIAIFMLFNLQLLTPNSVKNIRSSLAAARQIASGDTTVISYPSASPAQVAPFGSGLAVCDNGVLDIQLPGSYTQMESDMTYANPSMRSSDRYLLIFDRGANRFTVTNTITKLYSQTTSSPITNADIADNGNVAVVTDEAGYKSAVTVYNIDNEQLYKWSSADYYIMSAALSSDGERLAVFCFRQDGLNLISKLFFTDINSQDSPKDGVDMQSSLCAGLRFVGRNTVCAVTDTAAYVVTRSGQIRYEKDYAAGDLIAFDASGEDMVALCTTSYQPDGRAEIDLLNARGAATRSPLVLGTDPDSISYHSGRLAVLSGDTVTFYSRSLQQIDEQTGYSGASRIFMRPGNLCIANFSSNARVMTIGQPLNDLEETGIE